jgi:hypothetical protein
MGCPRLGSRGNRLHHFDRWTCVLPTRIALANVSADDLNYSPRVTRGARRMLT